MAAKEIISSGKIKISHSNGDGYMAICAANLASHVPGTKHQFLDYELHCNRNGDAACSCPDFQTHSWAAGACKHLRALKLSIEYWISQQLESPFYFPISCEEAENLRWILSKSRVVDNVASYSGGVPVPQVVQWDPTIIQNLGGDRTILGDDDDELTDSDSNIDDSDTEFGIGIVCLISQNFDIKS
jgi:hypothetical protein